ncbi:MAG: 5-hydroxyisourate hydrolase-like protein (transthyretin family) [Verrucomicrobiales bacterium]|jgi:5-hydroxyisourate hydrolase-like protein (transthyretin family)
MKRLLAAIFLISLGVAAASEHRVLLPDGSAAAGVEVRRIKDGEPDQILKTDDKGRFELPEIASNNHRPGALVIDAPGAALSIWNWPGEEMQLRPAFKITGVVELPGQKPAADATVSVLEFGTRTYMPLKAYGAKSPWKPVRTNQRGEFTLRGATFNGYKFPAGLTVKAEMKIDGRLFTTVEGIPGFGDADFFENPAEESPRAEPFVLRPVGTVSGQVVNELTGEPMAGAKLRLYRGRGDHDSKATTDGEGRFRLENTPTYARRIIYVSLPGFTELTVRETEPDAEKREPESNGLRIELPPLVTLEGLVVDAHSNQPALYRLDLDASRVYETDAGWEVRMSGSARIQDDGSFELAVPAGLMKIDIDSYFSGPYRHSWEIDIQPTQKSLSLKIPRKPGLVFEMSIPGNPNLESPIWNQLSPRYGIVGLNSFRYARGQNRWFAKAEKWGEKIELSVQSYVGGGERTVFERTEYDVQPLNWPIRIQLDESAIKPPE